MAVDLANAFYPQVSADLLSWYEKNRRRLPWRAPPGSTLPDPYRVWLSEIMLQQTTVMAVKPYFEAFVTRWPDVAALAAAEDAEVMAAWAGLGYYARARNLLACARAIVRDHGGRFPDTEAELRRLPGIGDYTAAAIAAIAFGAHAIVIDGNIERVAARLGAVDTPLPSGKAPIRDIVQRITPAADCGHFAQALMDLGSGICTPRSPACLACPIGAHCSGRHAAERYPVKRAKPVKPARRGSIFWTERAGSVLVERRPPKGLLGGMLALPTGPWTGDDPGLADAPEATTWEKIGEVSHVFTHFTLTASVYHGEAGEDQPAGRMWWPVAEIMAAGMPKLFAKAAGIASRLG